jgi:hypothetical protein
MSDSPEKQQVMPDNKASSVKKMFAEVPATYELVNQRR